MTADTLTERQAELLAFLRSFREGHGFMPTIREMAAGIGLTSTSTICYHLDGLRTAGAISWEEGKNRAITLIGARHCPSCSCGGAS